MRASFAVRGFNVPNTEFLLLDNTQTNRLDALAGIERFIFLACGRFLVICYQDIRLIDGIDSLQAGLAELDLCGPLCNLAGNAGGTLAGGVAKRISDPLGKYQRVAHFPFVQRVWIKIFSSYGAMHR